jgi:hypothetical protein
MIQFAMLGDSRNAVTAFPRRSLDSSLARAPSGAPWRTKAVTATGVLVFSSLLAVLAAVNTKLALVAGIGVLAVGLYAIAPLVVIAFAIPATFLVVRLGTASSNLSISDFVLFVATFAALPFLRLRTSPTMKRLLGLLVVYQAALLLTVVNNPYRADAIEWFHEMFLVGGSLVVGWVVARQGYARAALTAYLAVASVVALWTCGAAVHNHFQPVSLPLGMQKNFIGVMLMFAVFVAFLNPDWVGWTGRWHRVAMYLSVVGILAAQSRQAMIGCALGLVVAAVRTRRISNVSRRSKILLAGTVPLVIIAYVTISSEFSSHNQFNSVHQRQAWFQQSIQVWHTSPWLGVGLRWWYTARFPFSFQPPNGEMEMLSSAGIIGLAAFLFLFGRSLVLLWNVPIRFGTMAFTAVLMRFVEGQFDIFWVTAVSSIPWILAGLALGAMARWESGEDSPPPAPSARIATSTWPP